MEIKPYRSQVRETPTPEPVNNRIPATAGKLYEGWGNMISQAGQSTASTMYRLNDAMQKRQAADDDMALRAVCQDIDQAFLNFGNQTAEFFENDANDPNKVFYEDKSTYDKFYQDGINSIQINTIDKVKNPRVQEAARLYFNQKRMEAGQGFLTAYNANKKNAEAIVFGKELDDKVQKAISAKWDEDINLYKDDIAKTVNDMAGRGMIRKDQIEDMVKGAGKKIEYGRARKIITGLDYTTGKKFLAEITAKDDLDDETRKAIETYFDEYWRHQADIQNKEQADTFANFMHHPETITEEAIQGAFPQNPSIGVSNGYEKTLRDMMKKNADHELAEKQKGLIENYFQQIYNPDNDMYGKFDEIEKSVINNPDLTTEQKEDILGDLSAARGGKSGNRKGLSDIDIEWGDNHYIYHMAEFYDILTSEYAENEIQKTKLFGEFCAKYYVPPEKYSSLLNAVRNSYMNPRLNTLATMLDDAMKDASNKKDYKKYDKYAAMQNSLFETIFTDTSTPDGKPLPKPERDKKIDLAMDTVQKFIDGEKLDELATQQLWPNNPVFVPKYDDNGQGYDIDIDSDWEISRSEGERASLVRYTDWGKNVYDQFKEMCYKMISGATGEAVDIGNPVFIGDEVRFESGVRRYKDKDGNTRRYVNKIYTIKRNNGNLNIFETRHDGKDEKTELIIPYIIKRQWDVDEAEIAELNAYKKDVRAKQNAGIDIERANEVYETSPGWFKDMGMVGAEHERLNK